MIGSRNRRDMLLGVEVGSEATIDPLKHLPVVVVVVEGGGGGR